MADTVQFQDLTLSSVFQPVYNVAECHAEGYEGLVRVHDAEGQPRDPIELLETLEAAEILSLDRSCRTLHLRNFAAVDPQRGKLFLNMHPVAVCADAYAAEQWRARAGYFGFVAERVCIEVLEGSCDDEGMLVAATDALRAQGFLIAMDDFGVARSNFDRVAAICPDYVKLDRSILADAVGSAKARRMLPSVISLLHETGTRVVVEGVEDASQALLAIESGADYLQGYFFAPPTAHLHDDVLTDRVLKELVRVRRPHVETQPEDVNEASSLSGLARLLKGAKALDFSTVRCLEKTGTE